MKTLFRMFVAAVPSSSYKPSSYSYRPSTSYRPSYRPSFKSGKY